MRKMMEIPGRESDVVLRLDPTTTYVVHQQVLRTHSDFFETALSLPPEKKMMVEEAGGKTLRILDLSELDIPPCTMEVILGIMYHESTFPNNKPLYPIELHRLMQTLDKIPMPLVMRVIEQYLREILPTLSHICIIIYCSILRHYEKRALADEYERRLHTGYVRSITRMADDGTIDAYNRWMMHELYGVEIRRLVIRYCL